MPFKNSAQQRVCIGKAMDDIGEGKKPKWSCETYKCEHSNSPICKKIKRGGAIGSKIHKGPRGGYYFEIEGSKQYIPARNQDAMIRKFGVEQREVRLSPYSPKKKQSPKRRRSPKRKQSPKRRRSPKRK